MLPRYLGTSPPVSDARPLVRSEPRISTRDVRYERHHPRMRTSLIEPGDLVYCNRRGRFFYAKVVELDGGATLLVEPIERNVSSRHVSPSEIAEHWVRSTTTRRANRTPKTQPLELRLMP